MRLFDNRICRLTFTHSSCSDVWKLYFDQMKKFFDVDLDHFVAIDKVSAELPTNVSQLIYDEQLPYPSRLLHCLMALDGYDYIFFDHEDMFLYASPDFSELEKYYKQMLSGRFDHIRLIKGGDCKYEQSLDVQSLYKLDISSKWIFSIQPSFWKVSVLKSILLANQNVNIWELEVKSQKVVKKMNLNCAFSYRSGVRRGMYHFDNDIYPYVATAIGKGKWNLGEYSKELLPLLKRFNIDPESRGWF